MALINSHAGKIAHSNLFLICILNNFGAKIAALDSAEILLVTLFIC